MGYWKTHTGLDAPPRDPTYDKLPIFLGIWPNDGPPEDLIQTEKDAKAVFDKAGGLTFWAMVAQLLAAKMNTLKIPQFADAQFVDGATLSTGETIKTFGQAMAAADQVVDDIANGNPRQSSDVEAIKDMLDAANNACSAPALTPTPTPVAAGVVVGPTGTPSGLPVTGSSPGATTSWPWVIVMALALLALGSLVLTTSRKGE
jgi:hypothetical protein